MKVSTEESIYSERQIAKILHKIDPNNKFFIYIIPVKKADIVDNIKTIQSQVVNTDPNKEYYGYYMKYGGQTLDNYIRKNEGNISIELIWKWLSKLIKALNLLYQHKIVHLDVKLTNIVIDDNNDIRLIDFSLSNMITNDDEHS